MRKRGKLLTLLLLETTKVRYMKTERRADRKDPCVPKGTKKLANEKERGFFD